MSNQVLTPDNLHLSRPTNGLPEHQKDTSDEIAVDRTTFSKTTAGYCALDEAARGYVIESISENTRKANQSDLRHFEGWGGTLPAAPEIIAQYLADYADVLKVSTLARRLATLSKAHAANEWENPCQSLLVRATLQGIRRTKGTSQEQAKPLLRDDLFLILDSIGNRTKDIRDRALLLLGYAGGFRRSELVELSM